jgi:hypothetical protein
VPMFHHFLAFFFVDLFRLFSVEDHPPTMFDCKKSKKKKLNTSTDLLPNFVHINSAPREGTRPPDSTRRAPAQFSGEPKIRQESPRSTRGRVLYDKNSCLFFFWFLHAFRLSPVCCLFHSLPAGSMSIKLRELHPMSNPAGFLTYIQPSR